MNTESEVPNAPQQQRGGERINSHGEFIDVINDTFYRYPRSVHEETEEEYMEFITDKVMRKVRRSGYGRQLVRARVAQMLN